MSTEKHELSPSVADSIAIQNNRLKLAVVGAVTLVGCYKIVTLPLTVNLAEFSFNDLLALILALFSIALSVAFYFKATDTSNEFYNNTYRFTKDISEILGRIEAGFGERLKHLDEGYSGLRDRFDQIPFDENKAKKQVEEEGRKIQQIEEEKNKLIDDLAGRAKLQEKEKAELFNALAKKDSELEKARAETAFLRRHLESAEVARDLESEPGIPPGIMRHLISRVVPTIGQELASDGPISLLSKRFSEIKDQLNSHFLKDAEQLGWINSTGELTSTGVRILRSAARQRAAS